MALCGTAARHGERTMQVLVDSSAVYLGGLFDYLDLGNAEMEELPVIENESLARSGGTF